MNALPDEMRAAKRWLLYDTRKVPYYTDGTTRSGSLDSEADVARLSSFDEALIALEASDGRYAGLGFALGEGWQAIDLDDQRDHDTGKLTTVADSIIQACESYTEVSPSGTGVHIVGYGVTFPAIGSSSNKHGVEAYAEKRYMTVTGNALRNAGELVDIAPVVERLRVEYVHGEATHKHAADPTTDDEYRAIVRVGVDGMHGALLALSSRWVARGMSPDDVEATLCTLMDECEWRERDPKRWRKHRDSIPQMVASATAKFRDRREDGEDGEDRPPPLSGKKSQSDCIVDIALRFYTLHRSETGEPYALRRDGPRIALPLRGSRALRPVLARKYRDSYGRVPPSSALADALNVLEGHALDAPVLPTYLRVARHDHGIALDLGRDDGRIVFATPHGWELVDNLPIVWRRTRLTSELPLPARGGSLDELRTLIAVTDDAWLLVLAWLVATFLPDIAHPPLLVGGQHGTGKTTAARTFVLLVDPSPVLVRAQPRDVESWAVAAAGSWIVAIDNVSTISGWWSDAICRAVTGDGLIRRALYTDADVSVLSFRRCVIITSIDAGGLRGDLGDRILLVDLEPIEAGKRRADTDLDSALAAARPRILGALLDLLVRVLAELPRVHLAELPRMADYARVLAAMDKVLGTEALARYLGQAERVAADVIDSDPIAAAIRDLVKWEGTAAELYDRIRPDRPPPQWPTLARELVKRLRQLQPALRSVGTIVTIDKNLVRNRRIIRIESVSVPSSRSSPSSPEPAVPTDDDCVNPSEQDAPQTEREYLDIRRRMAENRAKWMQRTNWPDRPRGAVNL